MIKPALLFVLLALLSGCASTSTEDPATWLRGTLSRDEDGAVMEFRIQQKMVFGGSASGRVQAIDSGATFTGQYVGILDTFDSIAKTQASLSDGHGTLITLRFQIRAGLAPHGLGDGRDNQGRHYHVLF